MSIGKAQQQRFRISPSGRGAIFRMKRWFYATFYSGVSDREVKESNRRIWLDLSRKLIEEINKRSAADKPTRIVLEYEVDPKGLFKPISATVEILELKPVETFRTYFIEETKLREVEELKAMLSEILKKARELGVSIEELTR
ncbi:MAG: hypothetical protein RMJ00_01615 [Nitrososphaerota archaeon]|nr:hypothetical protein [Candidatus Bathyarchaeota archaeon]MCX8161495.1 hypothetical protein [Candidatus Bathyarchaeota archaeon]MDW8061383.1 hypothetical protein [Nitrososphaerota archaeon]